MKTNWFKIKFDDYFIEEIISLLIYNSPFSFSIIKKYLKQGVKCKDCNNKYYNCICNYCKNCEYGECLCNLNIKYETYGNYNYYTLNKIKNLSYKWIKYNLSKNLIKNLYQRLLTSKSNEPLSEILNILEGFIYEN